MTLTIKVRTDGAYAVNLTHRRVSARRSRGRYHPTPQAEAWEDGDYIVPLWRVDAKPFGDGTHGMIAFKGAAEAHREFDSQQGPAGPR